MNVEETRVDIRKFTLEEKAQTAGNNELVFKLNHALPMSDEYNALLKELFGDNLSEGSSLAPPFLGTCFDRVKIGRGVFVNGNVLMMARGGITIEDGVQIAANAQLISNNHDPYDLKILTCKPVLIKHDAWIGAGATIPPGVCVGAHAVVGAKTVVTKDVPDYAVVVGNPAKVIKMLDREKFKD